MKPEDRRKLSATGKKYFKFIEFDKDESFVCEIRKHSIGLLFIYLTGCSIAFVVSVAAGLIGSSSGILSIIEDIGVSASVAQSFVTGLSLLFILAILAATTIQAILYTNNVIFVTSEKIAQVLYMNIFNRKISQLSIGDVQDVTVTQKGILAHTFNYGTLVIETAGEQQNYNFTYIPEPYKHSKAIVGAHERNLVQFGN